MNQSEFIHLIKGKPWVNRAVSFDAVDCYGLVILYYKHVLNIELPEVAGFASGDDVDQCWGDGVGAWEEVKTPPYAGLAFTSYKGNIPTHVGIVISSTHLLHCRGHTNKPGKVEIHSIRTVANVCGKITYHKFKG